MTLKRQERSSKSGNRFHLRNIQSGSSAMERGVSERKKQNYNSSYMYFHRHIIILFFFFLSSGHLSAFSILQEFPNLRLQEYPLSCEISMVRNMLTVITGQGITENQIFDRLRGSFSYQKALSSEKDGKIIRLWGDPERGYVGDPRWSQYQYTGYGVYEKPLAEVLYSYGFNSEIINAWDYPRRWLTQFSHLLLLLHALEQGKFVWLWGDICTDPQYEDGSIPMKKFSQKHFREGLTGKNDCTSFSADRTLTWYYEENGILRKIIWLSGEHTFILLWYRGTLDHPTHIEVFDTRTGIHVYPLEEWFRKWWLVENRSLIVDTGKDKTVLQDTPWKLPIQKVTTSEPEKPQTPKPYTVIPGLTPWDVRVIE